MEHVQQIISDHLEAIGQVYGRAYQAKMVVTYGGSTHLIVQHPHEEHPQYLHIGMVEDMTEYLRHQAQRQSQQAA